MANKKFLSTLIIILLLFVVTFGGTGCGGGSNHSDLVDNSPVDNSPVDNVPVDNVPVDNSPDEPTISPDVSVFTVSFIDFDGSEIAVQEVKDEETATEPQAPEREGYIFLGWLDNDGLLYDFDSPVYRDIALAAEYAVLEAVTEGELEALRQSADISGKVAVSFDTGSPITGVRVSYDLNGAGTVDIALVSQDPMLGVAGLVGLPVSINNLGGEVKKAEVTFSYDPELVRRRAEELCAECKKLSIDIDINDVNLNDLAIIWYDESNDVAMLLEDSKVDTAAKTVTSTTTHFSNFGTVLRDFWDAMWGTKLPAVRTESIPYYDVVMALDYSGSMSKSDIQQCVEAAQGLVDVLTDDDYVTVIAFADYAKAVVEHKLVGSGREAIKQSITTKNPGVGSGTEFNKALELAKSYKTTDTQYQTLIVLLSDGGSSVSDSLLDDLNENGQKVITVGIGSGVSTKTMQRIADRTGGSYIFSDTADALKDAFIDLQETYIGSTTDTDGDGLPDLVETSGMRDQFGKVWKTNPNLKDTDGDGISDGEEMGEYRSKFVASPYFSRVSNPNKATQKFSTHKISLPGKTHFKDDGSSITLWIETACIIFEETPAYEVIYAPAKNVKIELIDIPAGFKLTKLTTKTVETTTERVRYKTTVVLSYTQDGDLSSSKWRITAGNQFWTVNVDGVKVTYNINQQLIDDAETCMAQLEDEFIKQICGQARVTKSTETQSLEELKKQIKAQPYLGRTSKYKASDIPEEVYEAFARAILNALTDSNVDKYDVDLDKPTQLVNQIYDQIKKGLTSDTFTVKLGSGKEKRDYTVEYSVSAMSFLSIGGGYADARVSWTEGSTSEKWQLTWASSNKEGLQALANYCTVLAQLELDLWKDFLSVYISNAFGVAGVTKVTKASIRATLDKAEIVIRAMCGDANAAEELAKDIKDKTKDKLKTYVKEGFKKLVVKFIPDGKKFLDAAEKIDGVRKKRNELADAIASLKSADDIEAQQKRIDTLYKEFKTAYNKLEKVDLFSGKLPKLPTYEKK